ncbi:MAG: response regulator [Pseudomonadota bacterium]
MRARILRNGDQMPTVFLIDDSKTILASMSRIIEKSGYEVQVAAGGQEAVERLEAGLQPSLIITDLNMPCLNGLQVIERARRIAHCRFIPILVLTTESQQSKRDEAKALGATGWLVKPADPDQLAGVLKQLIKT